MAFISTSQIKMWEFGAVQWSYHYFDKKSWCWKAVVVQTSTFMITSLSTSGILISWLKQNLILSLFELEITRKLVQVVVQFHLWEYTDIYSFLCKVISWVFLAFKMGEDPHPSPDLFLYFDGGVLLETLKTLALHHTTFSCIFQLSSRLNKNPYCYFLETLSIFTPLISLW